MTMVQYKQQTYREWLAECLDKDVEDITGLDMDADSKEIYDNLRKDYYFELMLEDDDKAALR